MPITYTNYFDDLLDDLRAFLRTEFSDVAILKGDSAPVPNQPTIILEPLDKQIDGEETTNDKRMKFRVAILCILLDANIENAVIRLTDMTEHVEQLLHNNKKYPAASGATWLNSFVQNAEYGIREQGGHFLRVSRILWEGEQIVARAT